MDGNSTVVVSKQALKRMPYYLRYLKELRKLGIQTVSAPAIAGALELSDIQVRKDLASVSAAGGRPKIGFSVDALINDMEIFLGYDNINEAVIVGVGHLGKALLSYGGFEDYGLKIVAAFDSDESMIGTEISGKPIFPAARLNELCRRLGIHIGIITVPAKAAQDVCDTLVESGIIAIWNFAPVHLSVPANILVQNENMAASLALLSQHATNKMLGR